MILTFMAVSYLLEMVFAVDDFKLFVPKDRKINARPGKSDKGQWSYILSRML